MVELATLYTGQIPAAAFVETQVPDGSILLPKDHVSGYPVYQLIQSGIRIPKNIIEVELGIAEIDILNIDNHLCCQVFINNTTNHVFGFTWDGSADIRNPIVNIPLSRTDVKKVYVVLTLSNQIDIAVTVRG